MMTIFFQSVVCFCTRVLTIMRILVDRYPTVKEKPIAQKIQGKERKDC